ncbi:MAG: glycosyltransferase [Candidatus Margulisiibacteriota bacterium]
MKILMVGLFTGNPFDGDETLAFGFEALGHKITKINYRKTPFINVRLPFIAKPYDLIIIGKGEAIWPITLAKIKVPKIFWYGDQRQDVQSWVVNRAKHCDLFLHTTSGQRLKEYQQSIKRPAAFFMVPCQASLYPSLNKYKNDVFFSGSPLSKLGDSVRNEVLNELDQLNNFKWAGKIPSTVLKGHAYGNEIVQSKISVSINHFNSFYKYNSDRIIHYACGGFVLAYDVPGMNELFQHIPTFKTVNELKEKINYYLKNESERDALRSKIITETKQKYNGKQMAMYILDCLATGRSKLYPQFEQYPE